MLICSTSSSVASLDHSSNLFGEYHLENATYEKKLLGCESGDQVLLIHEKNQSSKISCCSPFKGIFLIFSLHKITNDDTNVTLAVSPSSVNEDGTANLVYTFTRTGVTTNALTVNYTVGGTATFSTDYTQTGAASYTATTGTVNFVAGSATATVTVDPTADTTVESNETVALTLASGTGYTVGTTTAVTGTITNDDFLSLN